MPAAPVWLVLDVDACPEPVAFVPELEACVPAEAVDPDVLGVAPVFEVPTSLDAGPVVAVL